MAEVTDFVYPEDLNGKDMPIPKLGDSFVVAYSASAASDVLSTYSTAKHVVLRVTTTTDAFVLAGAAPTALADGTNHFLPAGIPQDIRVFTGYKLAFIQMGTAGSAYVTVLK